MKDGLRLVLAAIAVPVLALLAALGIQAKLQHEWASMISGLPEAHDQAGNLTERAVELSDLGHACATQTGSDMSSICDPNSQNIELRTIAIFAGLVTLAFFVGIWLLGAVARVQRTLLLLFAPALLCTFLGLGVLTLADAGLLIYSLYSLGSVFFSRIPVGYMFAIGIGALLAILQVLQGMRGLTKRAEAMVVGRSLVPAEHPRLMFLIDAICNRMGALKPQTIIVGLDPNFFVTEADVSFINGEASGRTLYISLPLCRLLSLQEFEGILAHEFGHFTGRDTVYSKRFYPIYRGTADSLRGLYAHVTSEKAHGLASLPALAVLGFFLQSFSVAESKISRDRELRADALAANITTAHEFASALLKVHAFSPYWDPTKRKMADTLKEGKQIVNASALYAAFAAAVSPEISISDLGATTQAHPTDSHPPLKARLDALHVALAEVSNSISSELPPLKALDLFTDPEEMEKGLSEFENLLIYRDLERRKEVPALATAT
jgi:Zn-dependent protease with chaperone function